MNTMKTIFTFGVVICTGAIIGFGAGGIISESESELKSRQSSDDTGFGGGSFTTGVGRDVWTGFFFSADSKPEMPELIVELNELFAEPPLWELSRQSFY